MRFNKKRIIAIMIFLLLSFFMMTFGNPAQNTAISTRDVTFIDSFDDVELAKETVELGKKVEAPNVPDHPRVVFVGWVIEGTDTEADLDNITDDITVETKYDDDINENDIGDSVDTYYRVTFIDSMNDETLKTQRVLVGMDATAPTVPVYENYTFAGWTNAYVNVRSDITTRTIYRANPVTPEEPEIELFDVTFVDGDTREVITVEQVLKGASASLPTAPTHAKRLFAYWVGNYSDVIKDEVVIATYVDAVAQYKVEHYLQKLDGSFETTPKDTDNKEGIIGDETVVELNTYEGYQVGTYKNATILDDNSTVVRVEYKRTVRNVTFEDYDKTPVSEEEVLNEGTLPDEKIPEVPNTREDYTCTSWNVTDFSNITDDVVVVPVCYEIYDINYENLNGATNTNPSTYITTDEVTFVSPGTREGYTFDKWYADSELTTEITGLTNETGDKTIYAKWIANTNTKYAVEHYFQNSDGTYLNHADVTYYRVGTTDTIVTVPASDEPTHTGYVLDTDNTNNVKTGKVAPDGSLVLKLYYTKVFNVTFEENGGSAVTDLTSVKYGSKVIEPTTTKEGYVFDGWYKESSLTNAWTFASDTVTENVTLYAKWSEATDTKYVVEHYLQNVDGTYPTKASNSYDKKGTTDTTVTVPASDEPTHTGYVLDTDNTNNVKTGKVAPDGSLVLKLYYTKVFNVTFEENGGSAVTDLTSVKYGSKVTEPTTTKQGYVFGGWYKESSLTNAWTFASDTVTENVTLYAKWSEATDTKYVVEHYLQNVDGTYPTEASNSYDKKGTTNANITVPASDEPTHTGYVLDTDNTNNVKTGKVAPDGSLVLKLYYTKVFNVTFNDYNDEEVDTKTVTYGDDITETPEVPNTREDYTCTSWSVTDFTNITSDVVVTPVCYEIYDINYENLNGATNTNPGTYITTDEITFVSPGTRQGYTFDKWYSDATLKTEIKTLVNASGDKTIYAKWNARTDTKYVVEHYLQNSDGTYQTEASNSYDKKGTTDTTVTVPASDEPTHTGYVLDTNNTNNVTTGKIAADGSLVLKLYYTKVFTVTFEENGGSAVTDLTSVKYGSKVIEPTTTKEGYVFDGWYKESSLTNAWTFASDTVTENVTLYAKWSEATDTKYVVEHYLQNNDGTYPTEASNSYDKKGITNASVTVPASDEPTHTGYVLDTNNTNNVTTGKIAADGSLVLKLYYTKVFTVTFDEQGGSAVTDLTSVKYGSKIGVPSDTTRAKYLFGGWYKDAACSDTKAWDFDTDTITENTVLYAKWIAYADISVNVSSTPTKKIVEYGDEITYTFTIKNNGTLGGKVTVIDTGLIEALKDATGNAPEIELVNPSSDATKITSTGLTIDNLEAGATKTVTIKVKVIAQVKETIDSKVEWTIDAINQTDVDPDAYNVEKTIKFQEVTEKGANIVLVLDVSLSMTDSWAGGSAAKFNSMKNAAKDFIDLVYPTGSIVGNNEVCVVAFAGSIEKKFCSTDRNMTLTKLKKNITDLRSQSGTSYSAAMTRADTVLNSMSSTNEIESVVFLSDGEPTQGNNTYYATANTMKAAGVKLYTIGFEVGANSTAENVLKEIARMPEEEGSATVANYYNASTTTVKDTFANIASLVVPKDSKQTVKGLAEIGNDLDTTKPVIFTINGVASSMTFDAAKTAGYIIIIDGKYEIDATKFNASDTIIFTYYKETN